MPPYNYAYLVDNVDGPVVPKHCWFYDAELNDFVLRPILLLEETTGWTVELSINGATFLVPASWNLLVVDVETKLIDTIQVAKCSSNSHQAFLMSPEEGNYRLSPIILRDLFRSASCVHVMIPRMHMLVHPVGPIMNSRRQEKIFSCLLSPQDLGKNMRDMTAMELLV